MSKLAERQILKAQAEGQLDGLRGEGEPLSLSADPDIAQSVGYRIMAEAGALPEEVRLRKAVEAQAAEVARLSREGGKLSDTGGDPRLRGDDDGNDGDDGKRQPDNDAAGEEDVVRNAALKSAMAALADLQMKLAIQEEARRKFQGR